MALGRAGCRGCGDMFSRRGSFPSAPVFSNSAVLSIAMQREKIMQREKATALLTDGLSVGKETLAIACYSG